MDGVIWAKIREMYFIEKLSKREIARRLRVGRETIRIACNSDTCPVKEKSCKVRSKLEQFKQKIHELLVRFPTISAVRILEEIIKEGYSGSITILKNYLSKIRPREKEAFVRIETEPGEQAQVDWADFGKIKFGEHERRLSCFVMVLCYSRMMYCEWCLSERMEDFIRCHVNAFKYFGGVTLKILYDNLKSVVLYRYGKYIHFNSKFIRFAGKFPFSVSLCGKGKGNEKGKVESGIKYLRNNFWAGRSFVNFEDLINQSKEWLETVANVRVHGTTKERPIDRFQKEKGSLRPVPEIEFDCDIVEVVRSSKDCRIRFDNNFYSVPYYHILKTLTVKASPTEVKIYNRNKLIAVHKRSFEKYKVIEDPAHIRGLLEIKTAAKKEKEKDEFLTLDPLAKEYFTHLISVVPNPSEDVKKILKLRHKYGKAEVLGAIEVALKYGAYGSSYIENIIITRRIKSGEPIDEQHLVFPDKPELEEINIAEVDLSKYDELTEGVNTDGQNKQE